MTIESRSLGDAIGGLGGWLRATFVHFDLGHVTVNGGDLRMSQVVLDGLPLDLGLVLLGLAFGVGLGVGGALLAGRETRPRLDRALGLGSAVMLGAPVYWVAYVALFVFARKTGSHPLPFVPESADYRQPWDDPVAYLRAIATPALIIALPLAAGCFQMARLSLLDAADAPHLLTARSKGISERAVLLRHTVPSAAPPVVSLVGVNLSALVFNAVLIETPFNMPGTFRLANFGQYLGEDTSHLPQANAIQGVVLVAAAAIAVAMLLCDVLGAWLDPKLR